MIGDSSSVLAPPPTTGGENQPPSTATTVHHDGLEDKAGDRSNFGGHRWPRQETLALLRIRSDMDSAFHDASSKGPLWDEVSRKLAELGYNRSGKKCKEKFENVYKYHKRTKEGRSGKSETKTYRFFDQLQALENIHQSKPQILESPMSVANNPPLISQITVPSTTVAAYQTMNLTNITSFPPANPSLAPPPRNPLETNLAASFPNISGDLISNSTSSSTSSDVELEGRRGNMKRKWTDFFERLMKGVVEKQEELQKKFLETLENREQERRVREEAWRLQEMARINREREILAHERSIAAAKDSAVMSFLQKIAQQQQNPAQPLSTQPAPVPVPIPAPQQAVALPIVPQQQPNLETLKADNNGENNFVGTTTSSRWPKVEVEALIGIRTSLDSKYQDNGPKGPLWEDISAEMRKIGYNRSAKRCKEKWENINKYFKKVKESNKRRPEDSKTCPYFYQLDALHREKKNKSQAADQSVTMPQNAVPLMVRPEQQWPPPPPDQQDLVTEDAESDQNQDEDDGDNEEEDDGGDHFRIAVNKPQTSMGGSTGE